jgi:5-hydroxyisourate hydrolase
MSELANESSAASELANESSAASGISTHVLDTALGRPAQSVAVTLSTPEGTEHRGVTNADGRVGALVAGPLAPGRYTVRFDTATYFAVTGQRCFYPEVSITFAVEGGREHYHVPLLLSPFGYSTYRGS